MKYSPKPFGTQFMRILAELLTKNARINVVVFY